MIIAQLSGGFGNQLFQYAAGLSLASFHNTRIKVDTALLRKPDSVTGTMRSVDISCLATPPEEATAEEIIAYTKSSTVTRQLSKLLPFHKRSVYKEKSNRYDPNFFLALPNVYLKGNRQSELYFKNHQSEIREQFSLSENCIKAAISAGKTIEETNSVAIHIRRGDYLTQIAQEWLGTLPGEYYTKAIEYLQLQIPSPTFYIFSDDIEWAKANLQLPGDTQFVSNTITKNHYEDFYLMSKCRHNIIANSTFSWWAAWLNNNPGKIVIAPKKWYTKPGLDTTDLIPPGWIRL